jgi:hypothetical protein
MFLKSTEFSFLFTICGGGINVGAIKDGIIFLNFKNIKIVI